MNEIEKDILSSIISYERNSDYEISAKLKFPTSFIGFKGHFPNMPILPGICKIKTVLLLSEILFAKKFTLKKIVQAKFNSIVLPDELICVGCKGYLQSDGHYLIKGEFMRDNKKISIVKIEANEP